MFLILITNYLESALPGSGKTGIFGSRFSPGTKFLKLLRNRVRKEGFSGENREESVFLLLSTGVL